MSAPSGHGRAIDKVPRHRIWVPPPPPLELETPIVMADLPTLLRVVAALRRL